LLNLFNIAMQNGPFIDDLSWFTVINMVIFHFNGCFRDNFQTTTTNVRTGQSEWLSWSKPPQGSVLVHPKNGTECGHSEDKRVTGHQIGCTSKFQLHI
jgi:hypothetical protein